MHIDFSAPLAERLRPKTIDDYIGQKHLVGKEAPLRKMMEQGNIPSIILWGPPGVGKTTLAAIIAATVKKPLYTLSAINSGVKDIREVIDKVKEANLFNTNGAILFIDEIHRFSKSQQDSLLGAVEKGTITLIGATTENPSFEVINALLSRSQVYVLKPLEVEELETIIQRAIDTDLLFKNKKVVLQEKDALLILSGGDARKLLNILEIIASQSNTGDVIINNTIVNQIVQQQIATYDKNGEMHYDLISAFIKSMRGSDPNATLYWMSRILNGGEDPLFIARRMLIFASEDIGNANPNALMLANNCFDAVSKIGMPESRIILSQCAIYLSTSVKSNASYTAIETALELALKTNQLAVPLHLRNAPTQLMKQLGYGEDYQYSHNYEKNFSDQEFLPKEISGNTIYQPGKNSKEEEIRARLKQMWKDKYGY
jgi:putative ATPase